MSISTVERSSTERAIELCEDSINSPFDDTPVMMARAEESEGLQRLTRVNERVLEATGYERDELLGHDSVEFMSEHSRVRSLSLRLSLLHVNSVKGMGFTILTKAGRPFDVLTDIDRVLVSEQKSVTVAAVYTPNDLNQWQQATTTMRALIEFNSMQRKLEVIMTGENWDAPKPDYPSVRRSGLPIQVGAAEKALGALSQACNDISLNLRGMAGLQEQRIDSLVEQGQEILSVVKTMDKSLDGLGNKMEQLAGSPISELLQTISSIGHGELTLHPAITRQLVDHLSQPSELSPSLEPITEREAEVLKLVAGDFSNKEIALKLVVTERTVDKHVSSILSKLHVANRTQATLCALRTGLATLDPS